MKVTGFADIRAFDIIVYRDALFQKMAASDEMLFAPDSSPGHLSCCETAFCQIRSLAKKPQQLAAVSPARLRKLPMTDADNSRELPDVFIYSSFSAQHVRKTCRIKQTTALQQVLFWCHRVGFRHHGLSDAHPYQPAAMRQALSSQPVFFQSNLAISHFCRSVAARQGLFR